MIKLSLIFVFSAVLEGVLAHVYTVTHQLYVPKKDTLILTLKLDSTEPNANITTTVNLDNVKPTLSQNWMFTRNKYDVVQTNNTDEKACIENPTKSCHFNDGITYTYVNNLTLTFTYDYDKDPKKVLAAHVGPGNLLHHNTQQPTHCPKVRPR
jgi:hypothetical protein